MEWNSHRDRRFHLWIFFFFFFFSTLAMRWSEGCSFLSFSLSLFSSFRQPRNRKIGTNGSRCFPPAISGPLDLIRLLPFFSLSVFFSFHRFLSPLHGFHPSFARYFSPAILSFLFPHVGGKGPSYDSVFTFRDKKSVRARGL